MSDRLKLLVIFVCLILLLFSSVFINLFLWREKVRLQKDVVLLKREGERSGEELRRYKKQYERETTRAEVEKEVCQMRLLDFKKRPEYVVLDREELEKFLLSSLKEQYSPSELEGYGRTLVAFGFLQAEEDLAKLIVELYGEQAGAIYDDKEHRVIMIKDLPFSSTMHRTILAHELTHALQDQNFNLSSLPIRQKGNDDVALASMALVEGDATLMTVKYFTENTGPGIVWDLFLSFFTDQGKFASAPLFIQRNLLFPYVEGTHFVTMLHDRGGWKAVDKAYADPPCSTEQIIHPEKYLPKRDEPTEVSLPRTWEVLGNGWMLTCSNVLGEFNVKVLLSQFTDAAEAETAAEGWDGDRYQFLENETGGEGVLVWLSVWDSVRDAEEFFSSYARVLKKKDEGSTFLNRNGEKVLAIKAPRKEGLLENLLFLFPGFGHAE